MNTVFSDNLKKFRMKKNYTQEHVADVLGVSSHTVSRWECGITLPDVLLLPAIAKLYEITVDDLYKNNSVAYENFAQRLAAVYEDTRNPNDFIVCKNEFQKLIKQGKMTTADKWQYGWIHKAMMQYCKDIALEWYENAVNDNSLDDPDNHHIACMQRIWFHFQIHEGEKIINELKEKANINPTSVRDVDNLLVALIAADKYEEAYLYFSDVIHHFENDWRMYIHGGDICLKLQKYDEAMTCYDKAGAIGTYFCDELYCKANLYEKLGEFQNAHDIYIQIAETLRLRGYDIEADIATKQAKECLGNK